MLPRPSKRSRIEASQLAEIESSASANVIPPQAALPLTDGPGLSGGDEEEKQQEDAGATNRRLRFWYPGYMACNDESDEVSKERPDWEESDERSDGLDDTSYDDDSEEVTCPIMTMTAAIFNEDSSSSRKNGYRRRSTGYFM
jgi:hypothetical protein